MSDCSVTTSETTASGSQEPTGVSVPIVGSSATDGIPPWENESNVNISSSLPVLSICSEAMPTNMESPSLTSASQITTPIPHSELSDSVNPHSLVQSGIGQHPDSTSSALSTRSICDSNRVLVDSSLISDLSIHSLGSQEAEVSLSEQQIPDNADHMEVIDTINSQEHFLSSEGSLRADILDASSSFHHPESSDMVVSSDITRSNLAQNLSALDQSSVSSTQESESLDMQNLLQEQHELNSTGSVSALSEYHLEQSEASQLSSVGSSSQLDMGVSASGDLKAEGLCLSPSSSSTFELPSGMRLSSCAGLPPVSTIIRSSSLAAVKERFEEFCPTTSIGIGIGLPPLLSNSGTFTSLSSIDGIQQSLASSVCDSLTVVTLASPSLPVSSAGLDTSCTTLMDTETVDVPHSSTMVSSSGDHSVSHTISVKPSSSVMTSLGPQTLTKGSDLPDINEPHLQQRDDIPLSLSAAEESMSPFPGTVPLEESLNIGASTTQVSLQVPSVHIEDQDQTVAAFMSQNRTEATINRTYALTPSSISLRHTNIKPAFSDFVYTERIRPTNCLARQNPHIEPQAISVSAIGTNVIMSTSNIDTTLNSTSINKDFDSSIEDNQEISSLNIDDQLEAAQMTQEMVVSETLENSRNSGIIADSTMQSLISAHHIDVPSTFESEIGQCSLISPSSESSNLSEDSIEPSSKLVSDIDGHCVDMTENVAIAMSVPLPDSVATSTQTPDDCEEAAASLEGSDLPSVSVATSAVAASVIQQLLTTEPPQKKLRPIVQHITGGVITSVIGTKVVPTTLPPSRFLFHHNQSTDSFRPVNSASDEVVESSSPNASGVIISEKDLLSDPSNLSSKIIKSETEISSELPTSSATPAASSPLPSLVSSLPSLHSTLKLGSLASLQASLVTSTIPSISMTSPLPNVTLGVTATTVSLLPSVHSGLVTAPIPAVPPILLPSILSPSLASAVSSIKAPTVEAATSAESTIAKTANVYSGLLKAGLSTVVKQEPGSIGSGPLPPFTVVSGLAPLVKRDLGASLANILLSTRSTSASPIAAAVRIKQEPGVSTTTEASASEFSPTNVLSMDLLPSLSTLRLPSVTPVGLPMVNTTVVSSLPSLTNPVPSQASTITFAENSTATAVTTASVMCASTSAKEKGTDDKKLCLMCKNGNPCGVHPTHGNSSQTSAHPLPSGDPAKPFQCNLCGKHLASKNVFHLHMRSHSGEKPFTCNLCGHHFSQKTSLTRHMRSHTGERPFPCDVCGKRFADKERIKIHMRTHTGEKPFACEICGKKFSQKSTVKRHMSVHTGEKPFKCETCGKGFANRGNLNAHSKTHANT